MSGLIHKSKVDNQYIRRMITVKKCGNKASVWICNPSQQPLHCKIELKLLYDTPKIVIFETKELIEPGETIEEITFNEKIHFNSEPVPNILFGLAKFYHAEPNKTNSVAEVIGIFFVKAS